MEYIERNTTMQLYTIQKKSFRGTSTKGKLAGMLNYKGTILKKINISFIVHLYLRKYSFSFDTLDTPSMSDHFLLLFRILFSLLIRERLKNRSTKMLC